MKHCIALAIALLPSITNAHEWFSIKDFPEIRAATPEEIKDFQKSISNTIIIGNFSLDKILIPDGNLHIPGSFAASGQLIVRGNLSIDGMYDDDNAPYGITAVLGDMQAENIYSWASLYVQGALNVFGILMAMYNDFTFEVDGKLNTDGLIVSDKGTRYTVGEINFAFVEEEDDAFSEQRIGIGMQKLLPELISSPEFRDPIYESEYLYELNADADTIRARLNNAQPVMRTTPASAEISNWVSAALNMETSEAELLVLINKDPLVAQLIAARTDLSITLIRELKKTADPIVLKWLKTDKG